MLVAAVIRNVDDVSGVFGLSQQTLDDLGNVALSLFLALALMTLRLWELAGLAVPLTIILLVQVALVALVAALAVPRVMGRDYESIVMAGGFVGFMLGTSANAMANMSALVERYGPAPKAFLTVPLVGAFFIDFVNAVIITFCLNLMELSIVPAPPDHEDSSAWPNPIARRRPRRGPTLTQQIFIGLALGIVAGWLVSEYNPAAAVYFRPFSQFFLRLIKMIIAPLIFATLVAGIAGAGHVKVVGRMGLRAIIYFEIVTTLALVIGLVAVNIMQPGVGVNLPMGQKSEISAEAADVGSDPAARRARVRDQGDGRRRRAADRRLQHPVRHRARHDRREGPAGRRLVRGRCRNDVQVHEHRHALRADRRRRGDRLHRRPRRPAGARQPRVARGHALPGARRVRPAGAPAGGAACSGCRSASSSRR